MQCVGSTPFPEPVVTATTMSTISIARPFTIRIKLQNQDQYQDINVVSRTLDFEGNLALLQLIFRSKGDLTVHSRPWLEEFLNNLMNSVSPNTWTVTLANGERAEHELGEIPDAINNGRRLWRVLRRLNQQQ